MTAAEKTVDFGSRESEKRRWAAFEQLAAGISAGVVTTICTHPLDLIKTRMQSMSSLPKTVS